MRDLQAKWRNIAAVGRRDSRASNRPFLSLRVMPSRKFHHPAPCPSSSPSFAASIWPGTEARDGRSPAEDFDFAKVRPEPSRLPRAKYLRRSAGLVAMYSRIRAGDDKNRTTCPRRMEYHATEYRWQNCRRDVRFRGKEHRHGNKTRPPQIPEIGRHGSSGAGHIGARLGGSEAIAQ
jgi:hypothetical protein